MRSPEARPPLQPMRRSVALRLVRLAVWLNSGCPCSSCERARRFDEQVRRHSAVLDRATRRAIHRDAWKVGRS